MLRFLIIPFLAGSFFVAGCTQTVDVATIIAQVQDAAVAACGFLPAAETITAIITAGNVQAANGLTEGATIADLICKAETAKTVNGKKVPSKSVNIGGVAVNGWFVS